jgi:hypothetical protein
MPHASCGTIQSDCAALVRVTTLNPCARAPAKTRALSCRGMRVQRARAIEYGLKTGLGRFRPRPARFA